MIQTNRDWYRDLIATRSIIIARMVELADASAATLLPFTSEEAAEFDALSERLTEVDAAIVVAWDFLQDDIDRHWRRAQGQSSQPRRSQTRKYVRRYKGVARVG
jgi:hypothetical protein